MVGRVGFYYIFERKKMVVLGFFLLPVVMFFSVFLILNRSEHKKMLGQRYLLLFIIWLIYIGLVAQTGLLTSFDMPPRIPLLILFPAFALIFYTSSRKRFKLALKTTPKYIPVYIQSFRIIVELLIFGAFVNGILPKRATFEGLNFDILVGLSAPVIGFLIQKERIGRQGVLLWNIVALCILSVTAYAFISSYYFTDFASEAIKLQFVDWPYVLLPAVLLPFAIFYHVVSIRQNIKKGG